MGYKKNKLAEQEELTSDRNTVGDYYSGRSRRKKRDWRNNVAVSAQRWRDRARFIFSPGRSQPVYDLVNAGPRRRFVVRAPGGGDPFIVHNCTQAVARDLLGNGLLNLADAGHTVVAHVHDEVLVERTEAATVEAVAEALCDLPAWAAGLPLTAEGYYCDRYRKE